MRLEGKVALITGGGTGIGFEIARKYVEEGAYVYIAGRREAKLAEAAAAIGRNVGYVAADVIDKRAMLAVAEKTCGGGPMATSDPSSQACGLVLITLQST